MNTNPQIKSNKIRHMVNNKTFYSNAAVSKIRHIDICIEST